MVQQVGGAAVAQHVGGEPALQADLLPVVADDPPRPLAADAPPSHVEEEGVRVVAPGPPRGHQGRAAPGAQPRLDRQAGVAPHGHQPFLAALAEDTDKLFLQGQVRQRQAGELGDAHPRGVEELEHGPVPQLGRAVAGDRGQQRGRPPPRSGLWGGPGGRAEGSGRRKGPTPAVAFLHHEPVQRAHRHQGPGDRGGRQAGLPKMGHVLGHRRLGDRPPGPARRRSRRPALATRPRRRPGHGGRRPGCWGCGPFRPPAR